MKKVFSLLKKGGEKFLMMMRMMCIIQIITNMSLITIRMNTQTPTSVLTRPILRSKKLLPLEGKEARKIERQSF